MASSAADGSSTTTPRWPGRRAFALCAAAALAAGVAAALRGAGPVAAGALVAALALFATGAALEARWLGRRAAEARRAAQEAERLAALGLATAGLAHELKNALMVVQGFAQLAAQEARRGGADAKVLGQLDEILAQAERTTERLRAFLRLARGEPDGPRERRPAHLLAEEIASFVRPLARLRGLAFEVDAAPAPAVDDLAARQALLDLLLNALEHGRTRVALAVRPRPGPPAGAELTVDDDGPGVAPELSEKVFERWGSARPGGHGLGLAAAREAAVRRGGALSCAQSPLGGARFVLWLPGAVNEGETGGSAPHSGARPPN